MKVVLLLIFIFQSSNCNAQELSPWKQFLKDSIYNADDKNYVYLYKTLNRNPKKVLNYSMKNKKYVLAIIDGDSAVQEKAFISPNLFQIVYDNYSELLKLRNYLNESFKVHKKFNDKILGSTNIFTQLGIRYGELHYNHFQKFSNEEIEKQKNKKCKKGMEIINQLYRILEEAEKS